MRELLVKLLTYQTNFRVLHWLSSGLHFDRAHAEISSGYYTSIEEDIDTVGEMCVMLGISVVNLNSACIIASENKYILISDTDDYELEDVIESTQAMLLCILSSIIDVLQSDIISNNIQNVGIKATLEGMYAKYDKEARYLNARRLK